MIQPGRVAIIAITKHGMDIAAKVHDALATSHLYASKKFERECPAPVTFFETPIKDVTAEIFNRYEALVYVVSLGAVVRTIAPFLKDKHVDPAVVVVDDKANYAISVLSGHVGGANELTEEVARILGARPVITTASDVGKTIPVDILGRELGWTVEGEENITRVSAAVVNEERIAVVQETGEPNWWRRDLPLPKNITVLSDPSNLRSGVYSAILWITDRLLGSDLDGLSSKTVVYRPKSLVLGMGCDRGVLLEALEQFVFETLERSELAFKSVRNIATIDRKKLEPAFIQFGEKYGLPMETFERDEINTQTDVPTPSAAAMKFLKVIGVAEPAALLSSKGGDLIVPKVKAPMLTLAVARVNFGS